METFVSKYDTVLISGGAFPIWGMGWLSWPGGLGTCFWGGALGGAVEGIEGVVYCKERVNHLASGRATLVAHDKWTIMRV